MPGNGGQAPIPSAGKVIIIRYLGSRCFPSGAPGCATSFRRSDRGICPQRVLPLAVGTRSFDCLLPRVDLVDRNLASDGRLSGVAARQAILVARVTATPDRTGLAQIRFIQEDDA